MTRVNQCPISMRSEHPVYTVLKLTGATASFEQFVSPERKSITYPVH
jgi:hypothetical protein